MSELNTAPTRLQRMILLAIAVLAAGTFIFGILQFWSGGKRNENGRRDQTNAAASPNFKRLAH